MSFDTGPRGPRVPLASACLLVAIALCAPPVKAFAEPGGAVHRVYNMRNGSHFYTTERYEADNLAVDWTSYTYEGIAYYADPIANSVPLYRLYNRGNRSYFYSADLAEIGMLKIGHGPGDFIMEGPAHLVNLEPTPGSLSVHRFYNLNNGSHFYTADPVELEAVKTNLGHVYRYEGIAFWVVEQASN